MLYSGNPALLMSVFSFLGVPRGSYALSTYREKLCLQLPAEHRIFLGYRAPRKLAFVEKLI